MPFLLKGEVDCGCVGTADINAKIGLQYFEHGFGFTHFELPAYADIADILVDNSYFQLSVAVHFFNDFCEGLAGK